MPGLREDWFPTSIWYFDEPDHAALAGPLLGSILAEREHDPEGMTDRSSILGWHSKNDLHARPEYAAFTERVLRNTLEVALFNRWKLAEITPVIQECWAIVNDRMASNVVHNHPHSILSGVYYLQASAASGRTFFHDPRDAPAMVAPPMEALTPWTYERVTYEPVDGRMLIFPSWLSHGVEPNLSERQRVILSFNVGVRRRDS